MSDSAPPASPSALLVSRDLFFTSKITGTAASLGLRIDIAFDPAAAADKLSQYAPACLILDLADPALDPASLLASVSADSPPHPRPFVIAFGSHVATARLEEARQAGCDLVLPRSRFSADLVQLLQSHVPPRTAPST